MQPPRPKSMRTLLVSPVVAICQLCVPPASAAVPSDATVVFQGRLDALSKHFHGGPLARWSMPDDSFNAELRLPGVSGENKMRLLDALVANAATIATFSPAEDRESYIEAAKTTLPWLSDAQKPKLQAFISAMDTKACRGLCLVKGRPTGRT